MKKWVLALVLLAAVVFSSVNASAGVVFFDYFELGSLSKWSAYDNYPMGYFTVDAVHSGGYSVKFDQLQYQMHKTFSVDVTSVDISFWFYDGLDLGSYFVGGIYQYPGPTPPLASFSATNTSSNYFVVLTNVDISGYEITTQYDTGVARSSTWYKITFQVRPTGTTTIFSDGTKNLFESPLQSDFTFIRQMSLMEAAYNNLPGIFYVDDVTIATPSAELPKAPGVGELTGEPDYPPVPEPSALFVAGLVFLIRRRASRLHLILSTYRY